MKIFRLLVVLFCISSIHLNAQNFFIQSNGLTEVCAVNTASLFVTSPDPGYSYYWTTGLWSCGSGNGTTIAGTGTYIFAQTTGYYTCHGTSNTGGSNITSNSLQVFVLPTAASNQKLPAPLPSGPVTCVNSVVLCVPNTFYIILPDPPLKWYRNNVEIAGATSHNYTATLTGYYKYRIVASCNTNAYSDSVFVTTPSASQITAAGALTFCTGGSVQLNANTGTGLTYQWKEGGQNIVGAVTSSYTATTSGNYTVVVTNSNNCSSTSSIVTVTVNPLPTVSFTGLSTSYYATSSPATLTGSPSGGTFSGPGITGNIFYPAAAGAGGPYTILYSYTNGNGCSNSASQQTTVTNCTLPAIPGSITATGGNTKVCPGDVKIYSIAAVSGATSYNWISPSGSTITAGQGSTSVTVSFNSSFPSFDTLRVATVDACGSSGQQKLRINRNNPTTPGTITATNGTKACPGNVHAYSIVAVANGSSYTWTPPAGSVISSGQGTTNITITYGAGFTVADSLRVVSVNACGSSAQRKIKISLNTPATPAVISGAAYNVCNLSGVPYSTTNVAGINYNWSFNVLSASVASGQGTNSITANFNTGYISSSLSVTATNGCGTSAARLLTIYAKPPTPGLITGSISVCVNQQDVPYSISPVSNIQNYTWTGPVGSQISDGITTSAGVTLITTSPAITVDYASSGGSVKVRANNVCGSGGYRTLNVTMNCRESVSVINQQNEFDVSITPNPNNGAFSINFAEMPFSNNHIVITDMLGRVREEFNMNMQLSEDFKFELARGIYYVTVTNNERRVLRKIIVE